MNLFQRIYLFFRSRKFVEPAVAQPELPQPAVKPVVRLQGPITNTETAYVLITCLIESDKVADKDMTIFAKAGFTSSEFYPVQAVILQGDKSASLTYTAERKTGAREVILEILDSTPYQVGVPFSQKVVVPALVIVDEEPPVVASDVTTYAQDFNTLQTRKQALDNGSTVLATAENALRTAITSEGLLTKAPYSLAGAMPDLVRDYRWNGAGYTAQTNGDGSPKMIAWPYGDTLPESIRNRTYYTLRTYWGPNGTNPILTGIPFTNTGRDGKTFPLVSAFKAGSRLRDMESDMELLGLGYYVFTGSEKQQCGQKIVEFMRAFFTSNTTGMLPHLAHAQVAKGIDGDYGTMNGFVDMEGFYYQLGAISLAQDVLTEADKEAMNTWVSNMLDWSTKRYTTELNKTTNPKEYYHHQAIGSMLSSNANIRILYEVFVISMMLFLKREEEAKNRINQYAKVLLKAFASDGKPTAELKRASSWTYSIKNAEAWMKYAILGDKVGIDIWNLVGESGVTLKTHFRWMAYHAQNKTAWAALGTGQTDNQTTDLIRLFRTLGRAATVKYASDSELMGWVNNYFNLLEAKSGVSDHYKKSGYDKGKDFRVFYNLYNKIL